jgi:hypothetical protein
VHRALLLLLLATACKSEPDLPTADASRAPVAPKPKEDGGWPAHIDATPPVDAVPRPDTIGPDVPSMPIATASLVFWVAKERIEIPGNWLACDKDADCITLNAHCAERTVFSTSREYADRALLRADRPCRGQTIPGPSSVTASVCKSRRCTLEGPPR